MFNLAKMDADHWNLLKSLNDTGEEPAVRLANFALAVRQHFADEEHFMQEIHFPAMINHMRAHAVLMYRLHEMVNGDKNIENMVKTMHDLLIEHVDHYDSMLKEYAETNAGQ